MTKYTQAGFRTALALAIAAGALVGCDSGSDSSGGGGVISIAGGNGGSGAGGEGGDANGLYIYKATGPGEAAIKRGGSANASFFVQSAPAELGDNPLVISANTTIAVVVAEPASGTPYLVANDSCLYISNGDSTLANEDCVTGVQVNSGRTLTLGLNYNGATTASISLNNDFVNNGTVTTLDVNAGQRGDLDLYPSSYMGAGRVNTHGTLDGQDGGDIYIQTEYALLNNGPMNSSGANSATGNAGDAGYIDLEGGFYTQNTGKLTANGGHAPNGTGGDGGSSCYLYAYYAGPIFNSGDWEANGGNGEVGGDGGDMYFSRDGSPYYAGDVYNSGNMTARGGNATDGSAGDGGYVQFDVYGGELRHNGLVDLRGGNSAAGGSGGDGGDVYVDADEGGLTHWEWSGWGPYDFTRTGDIAWSGSVLLTGGNAGATTTYDGGDGGYLQFDVYADEYAGRPTGSKVQLLGYSRIDAFGGNGDQGGDGATSYAVEIEQNNGYYDDTYGPHGDYVHLNLPAGNIVVEADINAQGGNALANGASANGAGGTGGYVYLQTSEEYTDGDLDRDNQKVVVSGSMNLSGGQNRNSTSTDNGEAGGTWIWGYNGVELGNILANGGNDISTGSTGRGGDADDDYIYGIAEAGITKVGRVDSRGGNGTFAGGDGNYLAFWGHRVTAGVIDVSGGNANPAVGGSTGGDGGYVELNAAGQIVRNTIRFAGGAGDNEGDEGGAMALNCAGSYGCGPWM